MQITNLFDLQKLKKGDTVHATFSDISGNVMEANGLVEQVTDVSISIFDEDSYRVKDYELWRMLSLVCIERDISFIREGNIMSDLEHVASALDSRLNHGPGNKKRHWIKSIRKMRRLWLKDGRRRIQSPFMKE